MPNVVKGSRQEKMVVVPHRPWRGWLLTVLVLAIVAGALVLGNWQGSQGTAVMREDLAASVNRLNELEADNANLRRELAMLERSSVMDQQAGDEIQSTILEMREYITELEKDVKLYRQAMTAEFEDVGLTVGQMDIEATDDPARFGYKLVMRQQESTGESYLTGHVNVDIVGTHDSKRVVIPLHNLTVDEEQSDIKLRFRYFQNIEGVLELPPDFMPETIEVTGVATAPLAKTVTRSFNWVVEGD